MTENNITVRNATVDDAKALLDIYAPYVENTAITFEYDVPTLEDLNRLQVQQVVRYDLDGKDDWKAQDIESKRDKRKQNCFLLIRNTKTL